MADPVTIGIVISSIATALIALIGALKIRKCKNALCEIECSDKRNTPPNSPHNSTKDLRKTSL